MHSVSIIEAKPGLAHTRHTHEGETATRRCGAREREGRNRARRILLSRLSFSTLCNPARMTVPPPFSHLYSFVRSFVRSLSSPVCARYGLLSPHLTQLNQLADYFASRPRKARVTPRVPARVPARHPCTSARRAVLIFLARRIEVNP